MVDDEQEDNKRAPQDTPDRTLSPKVGRQSQGRILGGRPPAEPTIEMPHVAAPPPTRPDVNEPRPPPIRRSDGPAGYPPRPTGRTSRVLGGESESRYPSVEMFDEQQARRRPSFAPSSGFSWSTVTAAAVLLVVIVGGIVFLASDRSSDSDAADGVSGPQGPVLNPTVDQLAQSTVRIVGLDGNGDPLCSGSGTFVSSDGMILTNAHVVTRDAVCNFDSLGIAVTDDSSRPPSLLYRADLLSLDNELDLAVLRVSRGIEDDQVLGWILAGCFSNHASTMIQSSTS